MASIINASTSGAGGLIQTADSSGVLALQAAGTTIASVSGTGVAVTGTVADSVGTLRPLVSGTAVASTSGTSVDFTGIPSWVKRVTVMFNGVSLSSVSSILVQIGTGGTPTTTGYSVISTQLTASAVASGAYTTGFAFNMGSAAYVMNGNLVLSNLSGNIWVGSGTLACVTSVSFGVTSTGSITLSGTLDRIRITTVNGTDAFDAGSINIMYE